MACAWRQAAVGQRATGSRQGSPVPCAQHSATRCKQQQAVPLSTGGLCARVLHNRHRPKELRAEAGAAECVHLERVYGSNTHATLEKVDARNKEHNSLFKAARMALHRSVRCRAW